MVRDQNGYVAIFEEMASSPAGLEASKFADFYGLIRGGADGSATDHVLEQSDACQAYCQALLGGTDTWVRIPPHRQPADWAGIEDPVCLLIRALYGHPNAGAYWEKE